jgi:hypothetical protein
MSVSLSVSLHLLFVLMCVGLGYLLRWIIEQSRELDRAIERMNQPEPVPDSGNRQLQPGPKQSVSSAASVLQSKADPAKLAELKANLRKS